MEQYSFSAFASWGLTLAIAAMGVFGIYASFLTPSPDTAAFLHGAIITSFAIAVVFALFLANLHAGHARVMYAAYGAKSAAFLFSAACAIGFCAASVVGVHLGYGTLATIAADQSLLPDKWIVSLAALFLAFAKPAMSWVIEARKEADQMTYEKAREKRRAEMREDTAPRPAAIVPELVQPAPAGPRLIVSEAKEGEKTGGTRAVMGALLFATTGGVGLSHVPDTAAPPIVVEQLVEQIQYDALNTEAFRRVVSLRLMGASNIQIMAEADLPRTTVYRWLAVIDRAIADVRSARVA